MGFHATDKDELPLIERQRAEIERLDGERLAAFTTGKKLIKETNRLEAEIARLAAQNAVLAALPEELNVVIQELRAEIEQLRTTIRAWGQARAAMNFVKINTPECAAAFDALGSAESALAAITKDTKP